VRSGYIPHHGIGLKHQPAKPNWRNENMAMNAGVSHWLHTEIHHGEERSLRV
jgi:hypothetical protein